jgi:hypothetical protein
MFASLRRQYAQLLTGAQLLLVLAGIQLNTRNAWLVVLALIALISVFAWLSVLHRLRAVRDTPTSKIASAAQGYVELTGHGQTIGELPLISKLRNFPCVWYRYKIEQLDSEKDWRTLESDESFDSFILHDGTGECVVDPEQAEIITRHRDVWTQGNYRYTEWTLIKQDLLYVIGQFKTQSGSTSEFDTRTELNELLTEWKKDMPGLRARFDLNNDGELDMQEWQLVRQAAKREVAKSRRAVQAQPELHFVTRPVDGKLFLISNLSQDNLSRRYGLWAWAHLVIFFAALAGAGWVLKQGSYFV